MGFFKPNSLNGWFCVQQAVGIIACFAKKCSTEAFKLNLKSASLFLCPFILQAAFSFLGLFCLFGVTGFLTEYIDSVTK